MQDAEKSTEQLVAELRATRARAQALQDRLDTVEGRTDPVLAEREQRYRVLSDMTSDCCWVRIRESDGSERRVWVTDSFERVTSYTPDEFDALGRQLLVHPDDLEDALDHVDGPWGDSNFEFRIRRKDGEVRWLRERMRVVHEGERTVTYGATWDVTDERNATEAVEESHALLEERVLQRTQELERANEDLATATQQAVAANEAKTNFLAHMSHEIRTPLSGIIGLTQVMLHNPWGTKTVEHLELLLSSANSLLAIVNDLLDFARIESGHLIVVVEHYDPAAILREVVDLHRPAARGRGLAVNLELSGLQPSHQGDGDRFRQIANNLVHNALKFTPEGQVNVRARAETELVLTVDDTGPGVPHDQWEYIFSAFAQVDESSTRNHGGTGLGLAICARLANALGGRLEVGDSDLGGARFTLALPL